MKHVILLLTESEANMIYDFMDYKQEVLLKTIENINKQDDDIKILSKPIIEKAIKEIETSKSIQYKINERLINWLIDICEQERDEQKGN